MRPAKMMLLLLSLLPVCVVAAQNEADVLILGAGTAGIVAANHLHRRNISFLLIEGAGETGGRSRSKMFGGRMVELGCPAFYGPADVVRGSVELLNATGDYLDFEDVVVRTFNGSRPDQKADGSWNRLAQSQTIVKDLYQKIKKGEMPDMSIRVALEYGNWFPKDIIDDVIEIYDYDYEFSKIPELISTKGFEDAAPYQERPFMSTDQRGMQALIQDYLGAVLEAEDPRLKLNQVVNRISYTGSSVVVTTASGQTFTGNYAIITFSMGVLKSRSVVFEPSLPNWKLDTIYKTSMDAYTQIYVKFNSWVERFWESNQYILHANPRRGYYPIIWNMEAAGFHPAGTNMLMFQVMGEEARRVERSDKEVVKAEIAEVLRNMYGVSTPEPEDVLVSRWVDDPLAMGSFSSRQVGASDSRFMDALTSRVGRLYFAGEAYHKDMDGFAEGATLSAVDTVKALADCMKRNQCPQFNPNPPAPTPVTPITCGAARSPILALWILLVVCSIIW